MRRLELVDFGYSTKKQILYLAGEWISEASRSVAQASELSKRSPRGESYVCFLVGVKQIEASSRGETRETIQDLVGMQT